MRQGPPGDGRADHDAHRRGVASAGLEQQEIFRSEGVDLTRVVIGHSGDTDDFDYLEELIANGSILGMDRFGIDGYLPTARRVEVIAELCRRGYADRMVLSHDASCYLDWRDPRDPAPVVHAREVALDVFQPDLHRQHPSLSVPALARWASILSSTWRVWP